MVPTFDGVELLKLLLKMVGFAIVVVGVMVFCGALLALGVSSLATVAGFSIPNNVVSSSPSTAVMMNMFAIDGVYDERLRPAFITFVLGFPAMFILWWGWKLLKGILS